MTLPSFGQFVAPLLQFLGEQREPVRPRVVYASLADRLGISAEARAARLPSGGQSVLQNRIGWAHDALKRAGLSSAPVRGSWLITDAGRALLARHSGRVSGEEVARIVTENRDVSLRELAGGERPEAAAVAGGLPVAATQVRSPRDLIEEALEQFRASVARDLLSHIAEQTPAEFEDLVLEVLHALGYGKTRDDLQRVGRSGDGGIDGVISLDRLGLQKVYVQAKKWQGQVGAPVVQTFIGALQLQGADRGVLITSGEISRPAREAARQARGAVVLIDGEQLTDLMIEHEVGVTSEKLRIPKVDTDFFEGE